MDVLSPARTCGPMAWSTNTNCAAGGSCGRAHAASTVTAEGCLRLCRGRPACTHWVWHAETAGRWARQCWLVEGEGEEQATVYRNMDNNTVTGSCDLTGEASCRWAAPWRRCW